VQTIETASAAQTKRVETVEKRAMADGFRVGAATIKIGGFIKADTMFSHYSGGDLATGAGRDFYVPGAIPVNAPTTRETGKWDAHVKQTRLALTVTAPVGNHMLGAYVEGDFQSAPGTDGNERVTNAYDFGLRRGYLTFDNWLFGQDWTTFQNTAALPETADFIGPSEGTVFDRQAQIRYTHKINDKASIAVSIENPETTALSSGALTGFDDDKLPDFVARLNYKASIGEFVFAGLMRQLSVQQGTAFREDAFGWGLSASGKIPFGPKGRNDIRFMLSGGKGIGRYMGVNFAPDAVIVNTPTTRDLRTIGEIGGFVALRYFWTDTVRSTVSFSILDVDNPIGVSALTSNSQAWSAFGNLFYSPAKGFDIGIEYRHAKRALENGQSGTLDRVQMVAKQSF
jgi:hypothetical protein